MGNFQLIGLAFMIGIMIVIQGSLNARLGVLLSNSQLASTVALTISACFALLISVINPKAIPTALTLKSIPGYLWITGGLVSFLAVSSFYYLIPRLGIASTVAIGLSGQLIFAAVLSHFGWFGLEPELLTWKRVVGIIIMILGVICIKS
ncbi:DMT family transporter [Algoriphagus sp. AK58]|uniref:DMT family transporter n=1 Tax=Algoriphagus sp. AK58 TaxID=1406877 RepID=UPI00164EFD7A|nr:DMT family transporter [Algoriphagus sp. AK58]MBC6366824.1 EamA-like transporter family protein [Algoriphagus sp. AK58]